MIKVICGRCKLEKQATEFNRNRQRSNGFQSYCKECLRSYKKSMAPEKKRQWEKTYLQKPEGRRKQRARWNVKNAVKAGRLEKPDCCTDCNKTGPVQFHHTDFEYKRENDLVGIWVCRPCHLKYH